MEKYRLVLSALRGLWGIVTPNLRKVSIDEANNVICLYFYYDHDPSEEEIDLSEDVLTEVIADFSEPYTLDVKRITIKAPHKIDFHGNLVYSRYEHLPD